QSRVFRNEMAPRFRAGDYAGGITAGMIACAARLAAEKGVTLEWDGEELRYTSRGERGLPAGVVLLFVAIVLIVIIIASRSSRGGGWWMMGPGAGGGFGPLLG